MLSSLILFASVLAKKADCLRYFNVDTCPKGFECIRIQHHLPVGNCVVKVERTEGAACQRQPYADNCSEGFECNPLKSDSPDGKCVKFIPRRKGEACLSYTNPYYDACESKLYCKRDVSYAPQGKCTEKTLQNENDPCDLHFDPYQDKFGFCKDGLECADSGSAINNKLGKGICMKPTIKTRYENESCHDINEVCGPNLTCVSSENSPIKYCRKEYIALGKTCSLTETDVF
jgi:hypothetical protein